MEISLNACARSTIRSRSREEGRIEVSIAKGEASLLLCAYFLSEYSFV